MLLLYSLLCAHLPLLPSSPAAISQGMNAKGITNFFAWLLKLCYRLHSALMKQLMQSVAAERAVPACLYKHVHG
jgi:hypothetical protein